MTLVIDTNIFVASLSRTSKEHWVIEALLDERFELCISTEILLEYEEILTRKYSLQVTTDFLKALAELLNDPDDNKFVDAAIAGKAAFLVSEDRDFRILRQIPFPKIHLWRLADFRAWYHASQ